MVPRTMARAEEGLQLDLFPVYYLGISPSCSPAAHQSLVSYLHHPASSDGIKPYQIRLKESTERDEALPELACGLGVVGLPCKRS